MSFLSTRSRSAHRGRINCGRCGARLTLTDHIRKDGADFIHERCPAPAATTIPEQRS